MKKQIFGIAAIIIVLAVAILLNDSLYIIKEHEQAVVLRFGKLVRSVKDPGLHMKMPIVLQVTKYDSRLLHHDVAPTEIVTKDKRTLLVDSYSKWRITDPATFYRRVRTVNNATGRIKDLIYSELWEQFGSHSLEEIVSVDRASLMDKVTANSNEKAQQINMGIEIADVRIKRADLPDANRQAVFQRMREERKRIATQFRSEGEEEANKIRATADKEKTILLAEAYKKEQEIRGEGDAEATRIYAEAYGKDPEFYEFTRSLESYRTALEGGNTIILSDYSEFLKYFYGSGRGGRQ